MIEVGVGLGIGKKTAFLDMLGGDYSEIADSEFLVQRTVLSHELDHDTTILAVFKEFLWSGGYGDRALAVDFSKNLQTFKSSQSERGIPQ